LASGDAKTDGRETGCADDDDEGDGEADGENGNVEKVDDEDDGQSTNIGTGT
jgi:hypothetical protein